MMEIPESGSTRHWAATVRRERKMFRMEIPEIVDARHQPEGVVRIGDFAKDYPEINIHGDSVDNVKRSEISADFVDYLGLLVTEKTAHFKQSERLFFKAVGQPRPRTVSGGRQNLRCAGRRRLNYAGEPD